MAPKLVVIVTALAIFAAAVTGSVSAQDPAISYDSSQASYLPDGTCNPLTFGCWLSGSGSYGFEADNSSTTASVYGLVGKVTSPSAGWSSVGVLGVNNSTSANGIGVRGSHSGSGLGVLGTAVSGYGVQGETTNISVGRGVYGKGYYGVWGETISSNGTGVYGTGATGISGLSNGSLGYGVSGTSLNATGTGVYGNANGGTSAYAIWGNSSLGYAGYFNGKVRVVGNFSVTGTKNFVIDHPLDPANKYLYHAAVESPEMKNVYDGVIELDENGEAAVHLPEWFEALNGDYRYQLTCIGGYAPVYVAAEIEDNQFKIGGGKSGLKVSWQVTGIRHDPYAMKHPMQVEADKGDERGTYLYPAGYGQPETSGVGFDKLHAAEAAQLDQ